MRSRFAFVPLFVFLLFTSGIAYSQSPNSWKEYTPPDRSFRIFSPSGSATELSSELGDMRGWLFERGAKAYFFQDSEGKATQYALFVFEEKLSGIDQLRKAEQWKDYVALMLLGDDDESQFLSSPAKLKVNGQTAEEYTYIDAVGSSRIFSRGRIFDVGTKVYFLQFKAAASSELSSVEANKFFDSFEITPKLRQIIPPPKPKKGDIEFPLVGTKPLLTLQDANSPDISFDGNRLLVFPEVNLLDIYDVRSGKKLRSFGKGSANLDYSAEMFLEGHISYDGKQLLAFTGTGPKTFNIGSGELIRAASDGSSCCSQRFDPARYVSSDLRFVIYTISRLQGGTDSKEFEIRVLDLVENKVFRFGEIGDTDDHWNSPVITSNGGVIAASRSNIRKQERNITVVWDRVTGRELLKLPFCSLAHDFSVDGKRFVTHRWLRKADEESKKDPIATIQKKREGKLHKYTDTTEDYRTEIWDLNTGRQVSEIGFEFAGHRPWIRYVALSQNGEHLVTVSGNYILVWDSNSGRLIAAQPAEGDLSYAKFSDDGVFLVSYGEGEVVRVWRFDDILKSAQIKRF